MEESEEELKSLLMKVKVESEKVSLKLNIQKMIPHFRDMTAFFSSACLSSCSLGDRPLVELCVEPAVFYRQCTGVSVPLRVVPSPTGLPSKRGPGDSWSLWDSPSLVCCALQQAKTRLPLSFREMEGGWNELGACGWFLLKTE